jgi:acetyl-CoA C-acetyltransferase
MRGVSIIATAGLPVQKATSLDLRDMGAAVVRQAMYQADIERVDALYASNMLADELQSQKHLAALIADEAGLAGIEALEARATMASGAAAFRLAFLAVAAGDIDLAVVVGVEKMSSGPATPALLKAMDARRELADGITLISQNAQLMQAYFDLYRLPSDGLAHFAVNAHQNALNNPHALFQDRPYTTADVLASRVISPPIRLLDCAPICDGAAAIVLAPTSLASRYTDQPVRIVASAAATDRFRVADRPQPLALTAARLASQKAYTQAGLEPNDINLFEVHDAFSIMACLQIEAAGFAEPGHGWRLAAAGEIGPRGRLPLSTMGGLKARGHPIGATALYQVGEIVQQLNQQAGHNQVPDARTGLMMSIGGAGTTILAHILSK